MRSLALALAFIVLASLLMLLGPDTIPAHRGDSCHPGQHQCQTDTECEDEEAYLLDVEEGRQQ